MKDVSDLLKVSLIGVLIATGGASLIACTDKGPLEELGDGIEDAVDEIDDAL